ncbi:hepatitis A virus cellular receptor 1 homolog%2C partial [Scomber scombrus]|uniref:Hepatitis A virus cellular receptor 1 homolog, partial n=1 Tax=Scomber scombrus TaxID=13677 RepID=A0AAV1Q8Z8_SCOSC
MTVRRFNSLLLLALLTVSGSSSRKVVGRAGEDVTLPCTYNIKSNGPREVCWNKGSIPYSGCNNQIISTDGSEVIETTRASSRYQLLGRLEDGDVSLTILKTTEEDAGLYGCRVNIAGWFNDEKHYIDLTIEKAPSTTSTPTTETTEQTINTSGQVTATTSSTSIDSEQQQEDEKGKKQTDIIILVCVLLVLIALVTAGIAVSRRRWNQHKIVIQFNSVPPAVELQNQGPAVENIYQNHSTGYAAGNSGCMYEV